MLLKKVFKNPLVIIGILMLFILYMDLNRRGIFNSARYSTFSCNAVIPTLKKATPPYWKLQCQKNNLHITIDYLKSPHLSKVDQMIDRDTIRSFAYKDLANAITLTAVKSPQDLLERVDIVRFEQIFPQLTLNSITEGEDLTPLAKMENQKNIANLLKEKVQVQESWK